MKRIRIAAFVTAIILLNTTCLFAGQKWPLVLFLHGRGESNGPLRIVKKWGPPRMVERGDESPYILVSPQCPARDSWASSTQQTRLIELLDFIIKTQSGLTSTQHPATGKKHHHNSGFRAKLVTVIFRTEHDRHQETLTAEPAA